MTDSEQPSPSRFVVGLDLGTTNSAMAYVDTDEQPRRVRTFAVPQVVAPGQIESRDTLPSFHYQPASGEFPAGSTRLPWQSRRHAPRDEPSQVKPATPASTVSLDSKADGLKADGSKARHAERDGDIVGHFARDHGTLVPGRMIASAKSWLCHAGVDRTADLLPWQGAEDVDRLSPVTVSSRYLQHYREAWDAKFPEHPLADQDFVLTLPASFDEVARELTVKAAKQAGLNRVVLIEEPQAAFYAWIDKHADSWEQQVSPGQKILVCDVGGGTSDFTLIRVRKGTDGAVQFHRVAVGDHLILGGDNCDLALAHHLEKRIKGDGHLEPRQWSVLVRSCRQLKETLMAENAPDKWTLTLPGSGSKLIGGGLQISVTRDEVRSVLVDGFFPDVPLDVKPQASQSGFQEFGLPYAADAAITKYLAQFLTAHRFVAMDDSLVPSPPSSGERVRVRGPSRRDQSSEGHYRQATASTHSIAQVEEPLTLTLSPLSRGEGTGNADPARPDIVLFNGGVFASSLLQRRVIESLERWFRTASDPHWSPVVLENERLDLAVARGAAYYGMVRRGEGVRIAAGLARTYYVGVESAECGASSAESRTSDIPESVSGSRPSTLDTRLSALCLLPAGIEPGHEVDLTQHQFQLLVSQPIEFPLYVSSTRLTDKPGDLVAVDPEQIKTLPPIRTVLKTGKSKEATTVSVILKARLTEIGTLDLWCSEVDGKRSWKLLFDVRSATQTDIAAHEAVGEREGILDDEVRRAAEELIHLTFATAAATKDSLSGGRESAGGLDSRTKEPGDSRPPLRDIGTEGQGDPASLMKRLAETLGMNRDEWPTSLLRQLWETLIDVEPGRRLSPQHEARWLNLTGYALRPGYGLAVDDWRVAETWKLLHGKLVHSTPACRAEWSILWRRVAGGLTAGQQQALAAALIGAVKQGMRASSSKGKSGDFGGSPHESSEMLRLLGASELLSQSVKHDAGELLLDVLHRERFASLHSAALWAIGRVGARQLVYGPLNLVVSPDVATHWLIRLMKADGSESLASFAVMQLARKTGDRYRDIDDTTRGNVLAWMDRVASPKHYRQLVREVGTLETEDQSLIFGEALPKGLRIL